MENLPTSPEQAKNNQFSNEQIPNKKPKKTWVEPELVSMGVEGGTLQMVNESDTINNVNGTTLTYYQG